MVGFTDIFLNIWIWIGGTFLFFLMWAVCMFIIVMMAMKTHATVELMAWMKGRNIALFFNDNRYVDWKAVKPEAGIVTDPVYGAFVINEKATYVDKRTKAVIIPFHSQIGASINVEAAQLADEMEYILHDEEQFKSFRRALAQNQISESDSIKCLRTSINFGAIKNMMTALIPHNVSAKIQMEVTKRLKSANLSNTVMMLYVIGAVVAGGALVLIAQHFAK